MGIHEGKTVIVTGASEAASLGYGIACAFAGEGANLVVIGHSKGKVNQAKAALERDFGVRVLSVVSDGVSADDATQVVERAHQEFGRIDVLVNTAQLAKVGVPLAEQSLDDFKLTVESGVLATFAFMQAAYPHLKESHGSVINFASGAAGCGMAGMGALAAAKEGVRGLSRVAATEWAADGITVNVICPLTETGRLQEWKRQFPDAYDDALADIPLGRFGDAEADVGRTCVFLASDDARYITGQTLYLQGGMNLRP